MQYRQAKKLHNEDAVRTKKHGYILTVVKTEIHDKDVIVMCSDGNEYHHTEIA